MKKSRYILAQVILLLFANAILSNSVDADEIEIPKSLDPRLEISLFASEPDVKTVTSLSVDSKGRVFVVENHTHFRPKGYDGPETDRIRLLVDTDNDGKADRVTTFFEGIKDTMSVAVHPTNGWIYVATRNSIRRIRDKDDDGKAEEQQILINLETESTYPHNGLAGFAFDFSGNVHFGFGENMGGDATLKTNGHVYFAMGQNYGDDGTLKNKKGESIFVPGGEGGIFSCKADGTKLRRIARGFWNPFHLCFDTFGRLFVVDNDPGNRPPCRFLSIVEGGNYGYKRKQLEPFISVNGETPGMLPMTASTGESPTGVIAYESDNLPKDYIGDFLVASWGEHRIDRYHLERDGAGFKATTKPVIAGGEHFRPAGIAVAPDGSLFVGDWADRSYPLHGKGRIWKVRSKKPQQREKFESLKKNLSSTDRTIRENAARELLQKGKPGVEILDEVLNSRNTRARALAMTALLLNKKKYSSNQFTHFLLECENSIRENMIREFPLKIQNLKKAKALMGSDSSAIRATAWRRVKEFTWEQFTDDTKDADPFFRQALQFAASKLPPNKLIDRINTLQEKDANEKLILMLALKDALSNEELASSNSDLESILKNALTSNDAQIRFVAVQWIGDEMMEGLKPELVSKFAKNANTAELFKAWLATLAKLDGVMQHWNKGKTGDWWVKLANSYQYVEPLLDDSETSPVVIQQALIFLPRSHSALKVSSLKKFLESKHLPLQLEVVRILISKTSRDAKDILIKILKDENEDINLRALAMSTLNPAVNDERKLMFEFTKNSNSILAEEALRSIKFTRLSSEEKKSLAELKPPKQSTKDLVAFLLGEQSGKIATKHIPQLVTHLNGPADRNAGQRIFFQANGAGCAKCHHVDGHGKAVGPSFIRVGGKLPYSKWQLVTAIVEPSQTVDPGYLPLTIVTTKGKVASGIYHKHGSGKRSIIDSNGEILTFKVDDIISMTPSKKSIMPDGLIDRLTIQEFRDLLAYLLTDSNE